MYYAYPSEDGVCFNRTFMELKLPCTEYLFHQYFCFNRTFMELKSRTSNIQVCAVNMF